MAPKFLENLLLLLTIFTFILPTTSSPAAYPNQYVEHATKKRSALNIVATTNTADQIIDWIPRSSQGKVASPPPVPASLRSSALSAANKPISELEEPGAQRGPPGTVPIPRMSTSYLTNVHGVKQPPPVQGKNVKRQNAGQHWYVSSNLIVANHGGQLVMSMYKPFVNNTGDFSLLQTAVTAQTSKGLQTVEAGWINYPNQVTKPHIFTFYTVNGYTALGNGIGGWNQDVTGWVQYDSTYFPGTTFSNLSKVGGTQYNMTMVYQLSGGNWWLYAVDRWIGYYPGSLFSSGTTGTSLSDQSDQLINYGEIYNGENALTNTDMGSGNFGEKGWGKSGYITNMFYIDTGDIGRDNTASFWDSDASRYDHVAHPASGTSLGSYAFLGGPGAGGVVDG